MTESDGVSRNWNFLATDEQFRWIQRFQKDNLIVPLVGDFAAPKTIRAVAQYVREHGSTVRTFYASNVEQYLSRDKENWKHFYDNVAFLPADSTSTFIRYVLDATGYGPSSNHSYILNMVHDGCISLGPIPRLLRLDEPISLKSRPLEALIVGNSSAIHSVSEAYPTTAVWVLCHLRRQLYRACPGIRLHSSKGCFIEARKGSRLIEATALLHRSRLLGPYEHFE
jgi:hypothetical protein